MVLQKNLAVKRECMFALDKSDTRVYNQNRHACRKTKDGMSTKKEKTRARILEKAYGLFARDGFDRVTMKAVCEAAGLSRGGLYSHFSGTNEIFEAILDAIHQKDEMNFERELAAGVPAREILERALALMIEEIRRPEDSLSLAMYEYAAAAPGGRVARFLETDERKWTGLIEYGVRRGAFRAVPVRETVDVILYAYQGIRMWSRIAALRPETVESLPEHIRGLLLKEGEKDEG